MVFDPISIIGIVGTLAGLVSFVANTVENLHVRNRLFEECFDKLSLYSYEFEANLREIKRWQKDWFKKDQIPYEEIEYNYLWGESGLEEIQNILYLLTKNATDIEKILRFSYEGKEQFRWRELPIKLKGSPKALDINDWDHLLNYHTTQSKLDLEPNSPIAKLFLKFSFAIYRNGDIKGRLADFKGALDLLARTSKELFWERHSYADITRSIGPQYLRRLITLETNRQAFLHFFRDLYGGDNTMLYHWELFLADFNDLDRASENSMLEEELYLHRVTLERALSSINNGTNLSFNFFRQYSDRRNQLIGHITSINYPRHSHQSYSRNLNSINDSHSEKNLVQSLKALREILRRPVVSSLLLQAEKLHKLVSIAASISRAVVLLYGTKWMGDICACRIINIQLNSGQHPKEILTLSPFIYDSQHQDENCSHFPQPVHRTTFLLLGVLLIELAIAGPIGIEIDSRYDGLSNLREEQLLFTLPEESLPSGLTNPLTPSRLIPNLLKMLPPTAIGHINVPYQKAVEQCFDMRVRLLARSRGEMWADELEGCSENIVKPLEEQSKILRERYIELRRRQWTARVI